MKRVPNLRNWFIRAFMLLLVLPPMEARRLETETSSRSPKRTELKARLSSFTKSVKRGGNRPVQNDIVSAGAARSIGTTLSQIFAATGGFGL